MAVFHRSHILTLIYTRQNESFHLDSSLDETALTVLLDHGLRPLVEDQYSAMMRERTIKTQDNEERNQAAMHAFEERLMQGRPLLKKKLRATPVQIILQNFPFVNHCLMSWLSH